MAQSGRLAFADFVATDAALAAAAVSAFRKVAFFLVLGGASLNAFTPHFKAGALHGCAHERDGLEFTYSKLCLNGIKRCAVFPSHFYDTINDGSIQAILLNNLFYFHTQKTSASRKGLGEALCVWLRSILLFFGETCSICYFFH